MPVATAVIPAWTGRAMLLHALAVPDRQTFRLEVVVGDRSAMNLPTQAGR